MSAYQIENAFSKFEKALMALEVMFGIPVDASRAQIDATIQRFEFTFEFFWRLLKRLLEFMGVEVVYPKAVLQEAYAGFLISEEKIWLAILQDRNLTSHTYQEQLADELYTRIHGYGPLLRASFDQLEAGYRNEN